MPEEEKKTRPEPVKPSAGPAPRGQAPGQPEQGVTPQGLTPEDLEAVLRAAGVQPDQAVAGTDLDVAEMAAAAAPPPGAGSIEMLKDVALDVRIELGRAEMLLEDVLRLGAGSVLTLSKLAGDAVDILVNGQLVARGEVMVLDDNFCVRVTEIVSPPVASAD
jgi:flagellar motor switch protein FliN/FliY